MKHAIDKVIEVINNVARDIDNGHTIVREIRPQEMRGAWINTSTKEEYTIGANVISRLIKGDVKDPRLVPAIQFVANQITAVEAKKLIDRLENLKAFW